MILCGNNLGERHRDLNSKVSDAAAKQTNFEELKSKPDKCDVDKLFKIDLASKYMNIDYILDVLKCGDVFYITRALKCSWLYIDDYSHFVNPYYLENNVFPSMSMKMKRKMLTSISEHVRNCDRAIQFYKHCIDVKLNDCANKFLVFTSDDFKLNLLKTKRIYKLNDSKFLKQFIGSSFQLALAYLDEDDDSTNTILELRFLFSVSEDDYLDILEYITCPRGSRRLGIRISKNIVNKHKHRLLDKPMLYINVLNKSILMKHLTVDDVKSLSPRLLPDRSNDYWSQDFYSTYKYILEKIPTYELYGYMREIYKSKYKGAEFEMRIEFYRLKYYEMLNADEREAWALHHIERDLELPGIRNYMWYKFVRFTKAFSGIKRYIYITPDKDERSRIVNILPETARNENDINEILTYYYGRHVNESEEHRESFINKVIESHDIYSFDKQCWTSLDKLLYTLDVYTSPDARPIYKFRSLIYHILHDKDLPESLKEFNECVSQYYFYETIIKELSEERNATVAKYMLKCCAEKIISLMNHPDYGKVKENDEWEYGSIKDQIQDAIAKVWNIIYTFKRPEEDCPEIVVQYMESNMDIYQYHDKYKPKFVKKTEGDFVRWLKQDVEMAIDGISEIRCNTYRWHFRLCRLFRKLKVYFANDVGQEYLQYFLNYLEDVPKSSREYRNIKMAVVGVLYLADQQTIISLIDKYVPVTPKIDRMNMDNRVLQVQKAICRLCYHARPPIPLFHIQKYITGDYVHFCVPMFYNYFANLPSNDKFIEGLLDAPLSIQKHGLRLAFHAYEAETLIPVIRSAWKKTKNVSLRMILYSNLFEKLLEENEDVQKLLYEVLKQYTQELNEDDHNDVYSLLVSDDLPDVFKGDFIQTSWQTVSKLSHKIGGLNHRISVIKYMERHILLVQRDFPRVQIIDDHVKDMLYHKNMNKDLDRDLEYYYQELNNAKWSLTEKYIVNFNNEIERQQSLQLLQVIMGESLQSWKLVKNNTYTFQKFIKKFIECIMDKDPKTIKSCADIVPIYQCILDNFKSFLKTEELYYLMSWKLKLTVLCRTNIHNASSNSDSESDEPSNISKREMANKYGKEVAKLIKESVRNNNFHRCFYNSIANIVNSIANTMCDILDISHCGFVYYVCERLIDFKTTETVLIALIMLPTDPERNWESEHSAVIANIIKLSKNQEVRSYLYEKYALSDFKVRSYLP